MNWFKRHLNLTWLFVALIVPQFGLIIAAKFFAIDIPLTFVNSLMQASIGNFSRGIADFAMIGIKYFAFPILAISNFTGCIGEREYFKAFSLSFMEGNDAAYLFIFFMLPINAWVLKRKSRSMQWLWLAFFLAPYVPIVLSNKTQPLKKKDNT